MKKIVASVGLVALGAAAAHAQYAPGLSPQETSKSWALSASLRGFYDDNYLTLPKSIPDPTGAPGFVRGARSSFGIEVTPSVSFNHSVEDTLLSASYVYDLHYYEDHSVTDQTHQFNAKLDHEFSERYKIQLNESFVIAQEPTVLDQSVIASPLRTEGNNVRNTASADFTAVLTRLFDIHLGYANTVYAYQEHESDIPFGLVEPSRSALLDRMDQLGTVDLRWKALPSTTGVFGYQYEHLDYTSPEYIIYPDPGVTRGYHSAVRNEDSHFAFVGVDESFTPDLNGSIRAGMQYVDYYNAHHSDVSPYVDASLTYQYMPQSSAQVGVKHVHNATDVAGLPGTPPVLDEESTAAYLSISHRVTSRFTVSALGQAQFSTFNGGGSGFDGRGEDFFIGGVNLAYHFTQWMTGEAGYNYNKLNSDLADRAYTRNQVYIGVRATY
ncbi:MAG TPA: outer membrane beta-barrel protein [Candidatus Saccharimonadales bacterium]|nr:outer membrane beta-barrel protein [Candidatus Saccharimonadales bacterium]